MFCACVPPTVRDRPDVKANEMPSSQIFTRKRDEFESLIIARSRSKHQIFLVANTTFFLNIASCFSCRQ